MTITLQLAVELDNSGAIKSVKQLEDQVEESTDSASKGFEESSKSVDGFTKSMTMAVVAAELINRAIQEFTVFVRESIAAQAEAERINTKVNTLLKNRGQLTKENVAFIEATSEAIKKQTRFDDDAIKSAAAKFLAMQIPLKEIPKLLQIAADYAVSTNQTLEQGANDISAAYQGYGRELLKISGLTKEQAQALNQAEGNGQKLVSIIAQIFGGSAAADLDTYSGRLAQMANAWDDLKKSLGALLIEIFSPMISILKSALEGFNALPGPVKLLAVGIAGLALAMAAFGKQSAKATADSVKLGVTGTAAMTSIATATKMASGSVQVLNSNLRQGISLSALQELSNAVDAWNKLNRAAPSRPISPFADIWSAATPASALDPFAAANMIPSTPPKEWFAAHSQIADTLMKESKLQEEIIAKEKVSLNASYYTSQALEDMLRATNNNNDAKKAAKKAIEEVTEAQKKWSLSMGAGTAIAMSFKAAMLAIKKAINSVVGAIVAFGSTFIGALTMAVSAILAVSVAIVKLAWSAKDAVAEGTKFNDTWRQFIPIYGQIGVMYEDLANEEQNLAAVRKTHGIPILGTLTRNYASLGVAISNNAGNIAQLTDAEKQHQIDQIKDTHQVTMSIEVYDKFAVQNAAVRNEIVSLAKTTKIYSLDLKTLNYLIDVAAKNLAALQIAAISAGTALGRSKEQWMAYWKSSEIDQAKSDLKQLVEQRAKGDKITQQQIEQAQVRVWQAEFNATKKVIKDAAGEVNYFTQQLEKMQKVQDPVITQLSEWIEKLDKGKMTLTQVYTLVELLIDAERKSKGADIFSILDPLERSKISQGEIQYNTPKPMAVNFEDTGYANAIAGFEAIMRGEEFGLVKINEWIDAYRAANDQVTDELKAGLDKRSALLSNFYGATVGMLDSLGMDMAGTVANVLGQIEAINANAQKMTENGANVTMAKWEAVVGGLGQVFGQIAGMMDVQSQADFNRQKNLRKAEVVMNTAAAIMNIWSMWAKLPMVAASMTALVVAQSAMQMAAINATKYNGQAHAGLNAVPQTGTYLLEKGEMVVPSKFNPMAGHQAITNAYNSTSKSSNHYHTWNVSGNWMGDDESIGKVAKRLEQVVHRGNFSSAA